MISWKLEPNLNVKSIYVFQRCELISNSCTFITVELSLAHLTFIERNFKNRIFSIKIKVQSVGWSLFQFLFVSKAVWCPNITNVYKEELWTQKQITCKHIIFTFICLYNNDNIRNSNSNSSKNRKAYHFFNRPSNSLLLTSVRIKIDGGEWKWLFIVDQSFCLVFFFFTQLCCSCEVEGKGKVKLVIIIDRFSHSIWIKYWEKRDIIFIYCRWLEGW